MILSGPYSGVGLIHFTVCTFWDRFFPTIGKVAEVYKSKSTSKLDRKKPPEFLILDSISSN